METMTYRAYGHMNKTIKTGEITVKLPEGDDENERVNIIFDAVCEDVGKGDDWFYENCLGIEDAK